jgi:hypothetical protein
VDLPGADVFLGCARMAGFQQPLSTAPNVLSWNMDSIFFTLSDSSRRGMLLSMARNGPQTAEQLGGCSGFRLSAKLKQLATLCESGLVVKKTNPNDGRKPLYSLAPAVPLTTIETGVFIDFGFCTLRLE